MIPLWLLRLNETSYAGIIQHELSFSNTKYPELFKHPAYLRIDIPLVVAKLKNNPKYEGVCFQYALYTDTDVIFTEHFQISALSLPKTLTFGPEVVKNSRSNSGVLLMNITSLEWHLPHLLAFADSKNWSFNAVDQGLIIEYFVDKLDIAELLPDDYNWKPYWGVNKYAAIIHFHGAKPGSCAECFATQSDFDFGFGCGCPVYEAVLRTSYTLYNISFHEQSAAYAHYVGIYFQHQSKFLRLIHNIY